MHANYLSRRHATESLPGVVVERLRENMRIHPETIGVHQRVSGIQSGLDEADAWFVADWTDVLMVHFEVDEAVLQRTIPFALDCRDGRAFVSLVMFTMRDLRPARGGAIGECLFRPFREQRFLNVRSYVRHKGDPGIFFIAEWMSDWLSVQLGPITYGLPYRRGKLDYHLESNTHELCADDWRTGSGCPQHRGMRPSMCDLDGFTGCHGEDWLFSGKVADRKSGDAFECFVGGCRSMDRSSVSKCSPGSLDEFLLERYTAFTEHRSRKRLFRIAHEPWKQIAVRPRIGDDTLLRNAFPWWPDARLVGANYSSGVVDVRMGRPISIRDKR